MTTNKRKAERLVRMLNDGYSGMKAVREVIALLEQWPDEVEVVTDPKVIRETFEADALHEIDLASEDWVDSQMGEL